MQIPKSRIIAMLNWLKSLTANSSNMKETIIDCLLTPFIDIDLFPDILEDEYMFET
eukprot:UN10934